MNWNGFHEMRNKENIIWKWGKNIDIRYFEKSNIT